MGGKRKSRKLPKTRSENNTYNVQFVGDRKPHATTFNGKPFELLEIDELVAAVKKNPDMIPAARKMFIRQYQSQTICIDDQKDYDKNEWKIAEKNGAIFLQAFGSIITGLWINLSTPYYKDIEKNIIDYCFKSLVVLEISGCRKTALDAMTQPFTKLCILRIEKGYVRGKIGNFNTWFPKLRHLYLIQNKISNPKLIQHHMPTLEHLTIEIGKTKKEFRAPNVEHFLHVNPQLVSLQLNFGHEIQDYDSDKGYFGMDFEEEDTDPIPKVNANVKKLCVHIKHSFCPRSIFAPNFHRLVEFELISSHELDIVDGIFKFILGNVNLKKLKLKINMDYESDRMNIYEMMLKLTKKLKFLTEMEISMGYLQMHEVAHIIGQCSNLTKLRVRVQKDRRRTVFRKKLGANWIIISPESDVNDFFAEFFHPYEELTFQRKN